MHTSLEYDHFNNVCLKIRLSEVVLAIMGYTISGKVIKSCLLHMCSVNASVIPGRISVIFLSQKLKLLNHMCFEYIIMHKLTFCKCINQKFSSSICVSSETVRYVDQINVGFIEK